MDFIHWVRSLRLYRAGDRFVAADRCGWIPGSARTRFGMALLSVRAYRRGI